MSRSEPPSRRGPGRGAADKGEAQDEAAGGAGGPIRKVVTVVNSRGLHARAAARFVKLAGRFDADIKVTRNEMTVSGLSIMGLMMLAASPGSEIEISAQGAQAKAAVEELEQLVRDGFGEE